MADGNKIDLILKEIEEDLGVLDYDKNIVKEYRGLYYQIERHPRMGYLCGYVDLPEYHTNGDKYKEVDDMFHGGITCKNKAKWIGFDCGHRGDIVPIFYVLELKAKFYETYKNVKFVEDVCESIIDKYLEIVDDK